MNFQDKKDFSDDDKVLCININIITTAMAHCCVTKVLKLPPEPHLRQHGWRELHH